MSAVDVRTPMNKAYQNVKNQHCVSLSQDESRVLSTCVFLSGQAASGDGDGAFASNPLQGDREQRR